MFARFREIQQQQAKSWTPQSMAAELPERLSGKDNQEGQDPRTRKEKEELLKPRRLFDKKKTKTKRRDKESQGGH